MILTFIEEDGQQEDQAVAPLLERDKQQATLSRSNFVSSITLREDIDSLIRALKR